MSLHPLTILTPVAHQQFSASVFFGYMFYSVSEGYICVAIPPPTSPFNLNHKPSLGYKTKSFTSAILLTLSIC